MEKKMETKAVYQAQIPGQPRSKFCSIRFTEETHSNILRLASDNGWTFSKVIGEAIEWFLELWPLLQEAAEKSERLAGRPLVRQHIKTALEELIAELDESLGEIK